MAGDLQSGCSMPAAATSPISSTGQIHAVLYAMMLVAVAGFSYVEETAAPLLLLGTCAACGAILVDSRKALLPRGLPKWILNAFVLLAACFLYYEIRKNILEGD